jgi:predicted nucleotidyltransferase
MNQSNKKAILTFGIIKTLIYFHVRKIRPTLIEVSRLLLISKNKLSKVKISEIRTVLHFLERKKMVYYQDGRYSWFLDDRKKKVSLNENQEINVSKLKKACHIIKYLSFLPGIKLISLCGTVALNQARKASDLDFFVITNRNRIWSVRFLLLMMLEIFGKRKKENKRADRACLNHFVAAKTLLVKHKDLYSAFEYTKMICYLERNKVKKRFFNKNKWICKYFPLFYRGCHKEINDFWYYKNSTFLERSFIMSKILDKVFNSKFFNPIENIFKKIQSKRIKRKRRKEKGGEVYWGDDALVFHPKPKGVYLNELFQKILLEQKDEIKKALMYVQLN